jgi:hypothetical protein
MLGMLQRIEHIADRVIAVGVRHVWIITAINVIVVVALILTK